MRLTEDSRAWWTLAGACGGLFLLMLDSTAVTLALPDVERELDASAAQIQWVANAYLLVIAALVVTAGRLGDIAGRKRVYLVGLATFAAGSVIAATAPDAGVLISGRALQGAGAAPVLGLSLALVSSVFPAERQATAIGIWTAVSSVALGVGPLVGGALVELDWRLIFWINIPLIAAGFAITSIAAPESRDETAPRRLDWLGLVALGAGLSTIVFAFVESDRWGLGDARTLGLVGAGILILAAFLAIERRVRTPIVELDLFKNGPYFGATAAAFALVGAYWVVIFFQPQYLQGVLGYSPIEAGLLILPLTVPMIVISPFAGRLIDRFGARGLMTVGMVLATAGLIVQTQVETGSGYGDLFLGFLLFGIALGCVYAPMSSAAMAAMPAEKAGIAAGVLAMNRLLAGAIGLAATGAVFQSIRSDDLAGGATRDAAFAHGLAEALWVPVVLTLAGAILTWAFVRSGDRPAKATPTHHHRYHL